MSNPNVPEDVTSQMGHGDSISLHSGSPLHRPRDIPSGSPSYPPLPSMASHMAPTPSQENLVRHVPMPDDDLQRSFSSYDAERAQAKMYPGGAGMPHPMAESMDSRRQSTSPFHHSSNSRNGSWDLLAGIRKFEHSYEEFDTRNASESHLAFADGDVPRNKFIRFYHYLLNVSIITRWTLFIVPVLAILWIPGILGLTTFPDTTIWGVRLLFWSIWLSVVWVGWWASLAGAMILPRIARYTLGVVAVGTRRYIDWLEVLHRYVATLGWTFAIWVSFQPLINTRQQSDASEGSVQIINTFAKLLFAFFLCAGLLAFEKFSIQWIAGKFHERSYAERIADQKFAVKVLVTLYRHSSDIPGRNDTLKDGPVDKRMTMNPKKFFRKALKGVKKAATTTTTALGNVASEIAGSSVLQPNSPQAMVQTALESANKTRLLARRLFYSFARPGAEYLIVEDIARFFPSPDAADAAFAIFDKDSNGDITRDEMELACVDFHREQLSIEHSMRDLDSAVGRLDNILMSVYFIVAILIIAVALEAQLVTLITGAGTLILGLSWLIGSSLAEVLTSIIFLFIKHPYDVGDRVTVGEDTYTVKEIRLLSTIFLDGNAGVVQAPNTVLNEKFIQNIRRSPQMSEPFTFDVAYSTTFSQIEELRELMVAFLKAERRDYQPIFDVSIVDIPEQEKMTLRADIKYKSNWQQGALRAKRRNKWICALKSSLEKVRIFGPAGDPDAKPDPTPYTLVPWEQVKPKFEDPPNTPQQRPGVLRELTIPTAYTFTDNNAVIADDSADVFGETNELHMTNPRRQATGDRPGLRQRPSVPNMPSAVSMPAAPAPARGEQMDEIELNPPRPGVSFGPL